MSRTPPPELDLHGLNIEQALARFSQVYSSAAPKARDPRLIVVHGWNASNFRKSIAAALHRLLTHRAIEFEYPFEGNRGRTCVRIGPPLNDKAPKATPAKSPRKAPHSLLGGL